MSDAPRAETAPPLTLTPPSFSSTDPTWTAHQFTFVGGPTDSLEVEVKDKCVRSRPLLSRHLGKRTLPLAPLLRGAAAG